MRCSVVFTPVVVAASVLTLAASGEQNTIATDRPGFMDSPNVLTPGVAQVEAGASYSVAGGVRRVGVGGQVVRFGLSRRFELRVAQDGYSRGVAGADSASGWGGGAVGGKFRLAGERGWRPALAVVSMLSMPVGASCCAAPAFDPTFKLSWSKSLRDGTGVGGNLNLASVHDRQGRFAQRAVSLAVSQSVRGYSTFAEAYVYDRLERGGSRYPVFNAGIAKPVGRDMQVDMSAGRSFVSGQTGWFMAVGLSFRHNAFGRMLHLHP